jgi:hypothetical protein
MEILNLLRRLLGIPGSRSKKTANRRNRQRVTGPQPIHLSPSEREQIESRIAEFIDDSTSVYAHAHAAIARVNALPLVFDWTGFMALHLDGQIVWVPYDDEPGEVEFIWEERLRNLGLFRGTKLHPDLQFLLPTRPQDAIDCPDCRGTGKIKLPPGSEDLADLVLCSCGGLGWLRHTVKP